MSKALRICFGAKTKLVQFDQLADVPLPKQTESYMPVGHREFVKMATSEIMHRGMNITNEVHALNREGQRYFGLMEVTHPSISSEEMSLVIGLRNSYDKSVPASIAAGNAVFICDNMQISGEIVIGHKHTKNVWTDLLNRVQSALTVVEAHWRDHFDRSASYKEVGLSPSQANDLIVRAYKSGAVNKVGLADVIDQWYNPNHSEFKGRNLWNLHNAFTEIFKGRADLLPTRSDSLHNLFDGVSNFSADRVAIALSEIDQTHRRGAGGGAHSRG